MCIILFFNRVEVEVRRLGGAFGGKLWRAFYGAVAAALGAHLTQRYSIFFRSITSSNNLKQRISATEVSYYPYIYRSVRMVMTMEDMIEMLGKRHGYRFDYKVRVCHYQMYNLFQLHDLV